MPARLNSRTVLLILAAFAGLLVINFGFEIFAPEVDAWFIARYGEGYRVWLAVLFCACILVSVAWQFLSKSGKPTFEGKPLSMPFSAENTWHLGEARYYLGESDVESCLKNLEKIDDDEVKTWVLKFKARWSSFQNDLIHGVLPFERKAEFLDPITADLSDFISIHEKVRPPISLNPFSKKVALPADIRPAEWNRFRTGLRERYQRRYDAKIEDRIALTMDLSYSKQGFSEQYVERFFIDEAKTEAEVRGKLLAAFDHHRSVAIIGNPGAGKTTVLLDLALEIMRRDEADPKAPLPIVLNLAAWNEKEPLFRDWVIRMLKEGYGVAKPAAEKMLLDRRILPFLDGLDELGRSQNKAEQSRLIRACSDSIRQFLPEYNLDTLVICSRRAELLRAETDLPVKANILVNPLQPEQVSAALRIALQKKPGVATEAAALNILHWTEHSPELRDALLTPFYFKIAEQVFDERTTQIQLPQGQKAVNDWLVQAFIEKKLAGQREYEKGEVLGWLGQLAANMNRREAVKFELADLQPSWLRRKWMYGLGVGLGIGLVVRLVVRSVFGLGVGSVIGLVFGLGVGLGSNRSPTEDSREWDFSRLLQFETWKIGLVGGLVGGLVLGLEISLVFDLAFGLVFGLVGGLVVGLGVGLVGGLSNNRISTEDSREWDFSRLLQFQTWKKSLVVGLVVGLVIGWVFGLLIGLDVGLVGGLFYGLVFGLAFGLAFGLVFGLVGELSKIRYFSNLKSPYQRLQGGLLSKALRFFFISIIALPLVEIATGGLFGLAIILLEGFGVMSMSFLFHPIFYHTVLRLCLTLENTLPLRLVRFLDHATTQLRFLDKEDGGTWRFRHQLLQDYFAAKWESGEWR